MGVIDLSAYKPTAATLGDANQIRNGFTALETLLNGNVDNNNFGAGKIFDPLKIMQNAAIAGQTLVWNAAANGGTGGWVPTTIASLVSLIVDSKLAVDTASWDIQSIPGNPGDDLEFTLEARGTAAGPSLLAKVNNDAGANYSYMRHGADDAAVYAGKGTGASAANLIEDWGGSGSAANFVSVARALIRDYAGTDWFKNVLVHAYAPAFNGTPNYDVVNYGSTWQNTAALNRITILPNTGNIKALARLGIWRRAIA